MSYDFRPYVQSTKPANGRGKGVFIKMEKLYMYPDGHGYIDVAAVPERDLPSLSQPFGDLLQGEEILVRLRRMMWKESRRLARQDGLMIGKNPIMVDAGHRAAETKKQKAAVR